MPSIPDTTRRRLLKGIAAASSPVFTGTATTPDSRAEQHTQQSIVTAPLPTSTVSGTITGPNGHSVTGATLWVFDSTNLEPVNIQAQDGTPTADGRPQTDESGHYTVAVPNGDRVFIWQKDDWFGVRPLPVNGDFTQDIRLDRQLLWTPSEVWTEGEPRKSLGVVTVWRRLAGGDPPHFRQWLFVELTDTYRSQDEPESPDPWDLSIEQTLDRGLFTCTFPEDTLRVNYGSQSPEVTHGKAVEVSGVDANHNQPIETVHPLRARGGSANPRLPTFPVARWHDDFAFLSLTSSSAEEIRETRDYITSQAGRIFGVVPGLGEAIAIFNQLEGALEQIFDGKHGAAGVEEGFEPQNPNTHDTVTQAWERRTVGESAVLFRIPFRFETEPDTQTLVLLQAEWGTDIPLAPDWHGYFGRGFKLGPQVENVGTKGKRSVVVEQGDNRFEVTRLQTGETVEEFYGFESDPPHSHTSTGVERGNVSNLFLFEGPKGTSLVVLHDAPNDEHGTDTGGGRVVLDFSGLPGDGSWVVKDDPTSMNEANYNPPIEWHWSQLNTDGGAFRGGLDGEFEITIDPTFERGIDEWHLLSGNADNPERITLDKTTPVTIRTGGGTASDDSGTGNGDWPMFRGGPARTGAAPEATGPTPPINLRDGWPFTRPSGQTSGAAVAGDTIYVGSGDSNVYALM